MTTHDRFCAQHTQEYDRGRLSAARRGYGTEWREVRFNVLLNEPMCRSCKYTTASEVDHISPRRVETAAGRDPDRPENLQPLCKECHSRKTVRFDGGFGNVRHV